METKDRYFLASQADRFERFLATINNDTRAIIRKNNQLNELYDLFLDFILDANQHLDKSEAKELTKNIEEA